MCLICRSVVAWATVDSVQWHVGKRSEFSGLCMNWSFS